MAAQSPVAPTKKGPHALATPPRRLPVLLRRSWYGLNQAFRRRIAHTKCTPDQYTVLRNLLEHGPQGMTQTQLAQAMTSDANTITSLLGRMEHLGWVERRLDPQDRRARRVRLKALGRQRFTELQQIATQLQNDVLAVLPPRQRSSFLNRLEQVAEACRKAAQT